jgi:hypothetical protein
VVTSELMLTIAQVSATFVAIIAGFYTTKILSISSEKQRVRNKIKEIEAEINQRNDNVLVYQDRIKEIYLNRARRFVDHFADTLILEDDLKDYTLEEIIAKYKELEYEEPDEYDLQILSEEYKNIIEKIRKELQERQPKPKHRPAGLASLSAASLGFNSNLADTLGESFHETMRRQERYSLRMPSEPITDRENAEIKEAEGKKDDELKQIAIQKALIKHYEEEIKSATLPKHLSFGYLSQVGFAATGVILPLTYEYWSIYLPDNADIFALIMFGCGLTATFAYISLEVVTALRIEHGQN